ncbi:MAG: MnhB domain-containing protein [Candidatus Fermentibacteria bacterium]
MSKEHDPGMSVIVKTVTRLTVGLILLYGIYIILHGHLTPGGGFAGGVIVALAFINLDLAFGGSISASIFSKTSTSVVEALGAIMLLSLGLIGLRYGGFLENFLHSDGNPGQLVSAGIIPLENIAISLKVGAGLFGIFLILIAIQKFESEKK